MTAGAWVDPGMRKSASGTCRLMRRDVHFAGASGRVVTVPDEALRAEAALAVQTAATHIVTAAACGDSVTQS